MNKKNKRSEDNRKKYIIPGGSSYQIRSKNAIHISPSNSIRHELSKCVASYMLRKWGDIKFDEGLLVALKQLEGEVKRVMEGFPKEKSDFITECVPKLKTMKEIGIVNKNRRIDLVDLDKDDWYEFECNRKIRKPNCITIYI